MLTKLAISVAVLLSALFAGPAGILPAPAPEGTAPFTFVSMGDGQGDPVRFAATVNQVASLAPAFALFNGDLENYGVDAAELDQMVSPLKTAGLFNNTFMIRGDHDNTVSGSAALWEAYFETAPNIRELPAGVANYVALDPGSDTLAYTFDFGNSIFIGLDALNEPLSLGQASLDFLDARLTYAEAQGLTHAFLFFHMPLYCVESIHCRCTTRADASCTPLSLVSVLNRHPIVSAVFQGHDHNLGWTHMDSTRVAGLTGSFEQFITSPSGGYSYNAYLYPDRMDYAYMDMGEATAFGAISVDGESFTVNLYKVGTAQPVWSRSFSKSAPVETSTPTPTPVSSTVTAFARNAVWKYYAQNTDLLSIPTPYYSVQYDDTAWASGPGLLGFGETYLSTAFANHGGYTYYFRKAFNVPQAPGAITSMMLSATYDDGFVCYINGLELTRQHMPTGADTYTLRGVDHESLKSYESWDLSAHVGKLVQGANVIACDVHNSYISSSDVVWDAALSYTVDLVTDTPPATATGTATSTPTPTPLAPSTPTPAATETPSSTPASTATDTPASTATPTPTFTEAATSTPTFTATATGTPTPSATASATPTYTFTSTSTPTFTPTPANTSTPTPAATSTSTSTPTATALPLANTGYLAPFANAPVTSRSGDNNGYETAPANAYADDGAVAVDLNSGSGNSNGYSSNQKDRHVFYNYGLVIPASAVIKGIELRLDARADAAVGTPKIYAQLSSDGGLTWTTALATANLGTTEATYTLGGPANTWGRTWTAANFSDPSFRVRLVDVASNTARDFYLDYIAVRVTYQP